LINKNLHSFIDFYYTHSAMISTEGFLYFTISIFIIRCPLPTFIFILPSWCYWFLCINIKSCGLEMVKLQLNKLMINGIQYCLTAPDGNFLFIDSVGKQIQICHLLFTKYWKSPFWYDTNETISEKGIRKHKSTSEIFDLCTLFTLYIFLVKLYMPSTLRGKTVHWIKLLLFWSVC
jgi:hypothetical protein